MAAMKLPLVAGMLLAGSQAVRAAEPGAEEHAPGLLSPDWGAAFWTIVLFIVLVIVLGKFVWPKILQGLRTREDKIREDLTKAEQANEQAKQTLADYQQKLGQAHADARKLLDQTRSDAEQTRSKLLAEATAESASLRQRAADEIELAKQQALQEIYAQTAALATEVAGQILQRQVDEADAQRLVEQSLLEMDQQASR